MKDPMTDPVCGMRVQDESIVAVHEGRQYAFCSTHCQQKFIAAPATFLQPRADHEKKGCCK